MLRFFINVIKLSYNENQKRVIDKYIVFNTFFII